LNGISNFCSKALKANFSSYLKSSRYFVLSPDIFIKNQLDALICQIYFLNKTLRVSDSSCAHHQEFFTVHTAKLYDIYHYCV